MLTIITGASQNHSKSLKQFLYSIFRHKPECIFQVYVYDLGLTEDYKQELIQLFPTILLRVFQYSNYPDYFNISINAGEYAWKPCIIYEVLLENTENKENIILWCDAGNIFNGSVEPTISCILKNKLYSPESEGNIKRWTHPKMIEYFNKQTDDELLNFSNRNGAILGFDINCEDVCSFIEDYSKYAKIKECLCPDGSSRQNHRQDQSLFSILYYFFYKKYNQYSNSYYNISIHKDCD